VVQPLSLHFSYVFFCHCVQPFVEEDFQFLHNFFLPREYAIAVPLSFGVTGCFAVVFFIGMVMFKYGE
jgi:dolichyl-phosphate mannosyltransferase polypeptide 2 regulatory subunit